MSQNKNKKFSPKTTAIPCERANGEVEFMVIVVLLGIAALIVISLFSDAIYKEIEGNNEFGVIEPL